MRARGRIGWAVVIGVVAVGVIAIFIVRGRGDSTTRQGSLVAQVGKRQVALTGTVPTEAIKREIGARAAELVAGAQHVKNDLVVDGGVSGGQRLNSAIGGFAGLPPTPRPLTYAVEGDTLTLTGDAASATERKVLIQTVNELSQSTFTIVDNVTVAG